MNSGPKLEVNGVTIRISTKLFAAAAGSSSPRRRAGIRSLYGAAGLCSSATTFCHSPRAMSLSISASCQRSESS